MKLVIPAGTTSLIGHVFMMESDQTNGQGKTALTYSGITAYYVRAGGTLTSLTMVDVTTLGTWDTDVTDDKLGFKKLDDTNAPGLYEVHFPNNILATGSTSVVLQLRATDAAPCHIEIQLAGVDVAQISNDATAANNCEAFFDGTGYAGTNNVIPTVTTVTNQLTAAAIATGVWQDATAGDFTTASSIGKALYINNVAPGGSGGHMISGTNSGTTTLGALTVTGATTLTGQVTGTNASNDLRGISVNMIKDQSVTCTTGVTFNANVGTTQPINFTGTSSSALVKSDVVDFGGAAGTFSSGRPEVNTTHLAGTAYASADLSTTMKNSINAEVDTALNTEIPASNTANSVNDILLDVLTIANINATVDTAIGDAALADAVWDEVITSGHTGVGKAATVINDILTDTGTTLDGKIDTIDGIVDDIHGTDLPAVKTDTAAILLDTGTDGVVLKAAGLDADAVDEILDEVVEGTVTVRQALRLMMSVLTGKSSGGGTATLVFRDIGDTKNRISCTVDADGNRTAVGTRDGS